jgi:hypothetical protein
MPRICLVVLAACSSTTSINGFDAGADAKPFFDARIDGPLPPDAYAARPCDAPLTFADSHAPSRVLHVAAGAVNGDGSVQRPFGSIVAAAAVATPGTFIQLAPAVGGARHASDQFIAGMSGTPTAPIWIGGVFGTLPQLLGGAEGIHLTDAHYVVIQNLEIGNVAVNAINLDDGVDYSGDAGPIAIVNVHAHDAAGTAESSCVKASGVQGLHVYDSRLRRCDIGVDGIGVHDTVIARNKVEATPTAGVRVRGGASDVDIRQNTIDGGGSTAISLGGFTPFSRFRPPVSPTAPNAEARRVRAFNNVVRGDMHAAFVLDGCVDCLVAHNWVTGDEQRILRLLQNTTSQGAYTFESTRNGRVINNSFTWSIISLLEHVEVGAGVSASTFTFSHNLWNCREMPSQSRPNLPVPETGQVQGMGTGYYDGNATLPQYCGGPEAYRATVLPDVDGTIEGWCRSAGDAPTIGPQVLMLGGCTI